MTTAITSDSKELLMMFYREALHFGILENYEWNMTVKGYGFPIEGIVLYHDKEDPMSLYIHQPIGDIYQSLTPENYSEVLQTIINTYKK